MRAALEFLPYTGTDYYGSALTRLKARVLFIDEIDASLTADDLAVLVTQLGGLKRITHFHNRYPVDGAPLLRAALAKGGRSILNRPDPCN